MPPRPLSGRALAALALSTALPLLAAACSGAAARPPSPATPPPPSPPPPPPAASLVAGAEDAPSDAGAAEGSHTATPDAAAGVDARSGGENDAPVACPPEMVLIDGDYCTDLELKCLSSRYAKQNRKTICHEFASPSTCVGNKVKKRYCVDKYEYPNKKGERPVVMNNFPQAQRLCAAQGKRVCTESEWTMACEGPDYKPYPYGYKRDPSKCRGDRPYRFPSVDKMVSKDKAEQKAEIERLWDGVASGSQPECVSDYGVHDMPGNADELAASETPEPRSKYDNVTTGGPWVDGVRNQCRPKIYDHNEGFQYYYLSFRCCAEPDGKPTDPRSPKQIKRKEKWRG